MNGLQMPWLRLDGRRALVTGAGRASGRPSPARWPVPGHVGAARRTVYCASKHAIEGLAKAMAVELGPSGIRVNTIAPTFVETEMTRPYFADPAFRAETLAKIRLGRLATVADVAGAAVFLASDAAAMITGTSLRVDGGWTAG